MILAVLGMKMIDNEIITLFIEDPKAAISANARTRAGKAIMASINLWTTRSYSPPK